MGVALELTVQWSKQRRNSGIGSGCVPWSITAQDATAERVAEGGGTFPTRPPEEPGNANLTWTLWVLGVANQGSADKSSLQKEQPLCPRV